MLRYVYWKDSDFWVGYIEDFPDYRTQGETLDELKENLVDLYQDMTDGSIPCIHTSLH